MPRVVRWYLRTALLMLVLGLAVGAVQAAGGKLSFLPSGLTPVYFHLLMVGWVTQFILGVALWMLPKYSLEKPRGLEALSWAAYGLLNLGLLARALGEPLSSIHPGSGWGWMLVGSALAQWLAGVLFTANAWKRVKGK